MTPRTIIIGLDGVPYNLLTDLSARGITPNIKQLISSSYFRKMRSSIPEISSVAWSSIITGKNPGEHSIYGFIDLYPGTYKIRFPNFNDLKASPFWERSDRQSVIFNVPATYPVKPMRGVHISGFVSIRLEKSVYPGSLLQKLQEYDYRVDVDSEKAHKSYDLFLSDLNKTLDARIEAYRYIWENTEWDLFMIVFTGTDRLMHFLWNAYEDENNKYHRAFLDFFRRVDETIGEIWGRLDEKDRLIMLSDHGFERLDWDVYINHVLKKEGYLQFKNSKQTLDNMAPSTIAFALDPARIYINFKDRYPAGRVEEKDREKILTDLEALFTSIEIDGRPVIRAIYRKEDIYSGPYLAQASDLILIGDEGFNLRGSLMAKELIDKPIFTGKHTLDTAFLLVRGYTDNLPESPRVEDTYSLFINGDLSSPSTDYY